MTTTRLPALEAVRQDELQPGDVLYLGATRLPAPAQTRRATVVGRLQSDDDDARFRCRDAVNGREFTLLGRPHVPRFREQRRPV